MCARFGRAGSPRGRGGIFNAAFGVVIPLAGGRCVPRTGVHLDCPLGAAWPAALPCLPPLPHSGAICSSKGAGALNQRATVGVPRRRRLSQRLDRKFPFYGKVSGREERWHNLFFLG